MSPNRRIFLNIVATYSRSVYALVIGLFTARWVLASLGEIDYGLMGVVGGLVGFISFFNSLMSASVSRFLAFSVGKGLGAGADGSAVEDCRRWFSVAVALHVVIPLVLVLVGEPIGEWAIRHFLTIPGGRIETCVWVFRLSCLASFVTMVTVPFNAMYNAKQEIAELTIYGFASTTITAVVVYYMVSHPGDWLLGYAGLMCFVSVVPALIISARSFVKYPEVRIVPSYMWDPNRIKDLCKFAGMRFLGALAQLFSTNGVVVLVNRYLGPGGNAAMTIGNSVSNHTRTLAASFSGAFYPAITNMAGAGDLATMRKFSLNVCKYSTAALLIFAVPLMVELDTVLKLWLKNPPEGSVILCGAYLIVTLMQYVTEGCWMGVYAIGRIAKFQLFEAGSYILTFIISLILLRSGVGIMAVGVGILVSHFFVQLVKLHFGRKEFGFERSLWLREVLLPFITIVCVSVGCCTVIRICFDSSFMRLCLIVAVAELVLIPMIWLVVLRVAEREAIATRLLGFFQKSDSAGILIDQFLKIKRNFFNRRSR